MPQRRGNMKIEVGQIWQVIDNDFWSSDKSKFTASKEFGNREIRIKLLQGEFIEIRFPFEWHFRTIDNIYLHAFPQEILKHCRLYGTINEDVNFANKKDLKEILEEGLYKPVWEE
jgi:hypothetical protein